MLLVSVISRYYQGMISFCFISGCYLVWKLRKYEKYIKKNVYIFFNYLFFAFIEQDSERQETKILSYTFLMLPLIVKHILMNCLKEKKVWLDSPADYCEILANIILNLCFIPFPFCFNFTFAICHKYTAA